MAITKVVLASGKVDVDVGWGKPHRERVISDGAAYAVTQVLEQNMLHGTGTGAYFGRTSAGKTGTTDNYADAWFCGYVPQLVGTVWVGYPKAEIPMLSVHGIAVSGPTFPAQIWHYFMQEAVGNQPALDFATPSTQPVWVPFRGQYQYSGAPVDTSTTGTTGTTTGTTTAAGPPTVETVKPTPTAPPPAPTPVPTPTPTATTPAPAPAPTVAEPPPGPPADGTTVP
jgi:penicillin-binding protein 1A